MKVRLSPLAAALTLISFISTPVFAATKQNLEASVSKLEKEVASLKNQVAKNNRGVSTSGQTYQATPETKAPVTNVITPSGSTVYLPFDPDVPGQALVSSGPYVGNNFQFAGSDLIVNSPSVNTDVQLLSIRKNITSHLNAIRTEMDLAPAHSHVLLSGVIEGQANYTHFGEGPSTSDINVSNVSLDTTIFGPSDWILGYVELSYNDGTPMSDVFVSTSNFRTGNSRVYVNKAFVTLGNFNCSPLYATLGQYYVPFGTYSSVMVSDPLTKLLARTKARALTLGIQQQGPNAFYASGYGFAGDTHEDSGSPRINNGGINLGYKFDAGFFKGNVGGGVIGNIADSVGMQAGTGFQYAENIAHRVPAYDLRASLSLGDHIDLIGEYIAATKEFGLNDMTFNNDGAQPTAYDLEASYSFTIFDNKPSSVGVGFGKSSQALALGIPLTRTSVVFNTSLMRNTVQSLEFRHDQEYANTDVATGAGNSFVASQSGKADNAVTAQFDYYF